MRKYNNKPTTIDNLRFDSRAEADYYLYLKALEHNGEITAIQVHPRYLLLDGFNRTEDGKMIHERPIYYEADFSHTDKATGMMVVTDVKGVETQAWVIKRKWFLHNYPDVELRVVKV